jgi:putative transposase
MPEAARKQWRQVADQARPRISKLASLMDDAEADVLAYMGFPAQHRTKIHSTNPLERLNGEIKHRREVGIFPNEAVVIRLVHRFQRWNRIRVHDPACRTKCGRQADD